MKQTAVEWLVEQFNLQAYIPHIEQAKEIEKQQKDDYAIEFAEWSFWLKRREYEGQMEFYYNDKPNTTKELLEIFKKEKGL